MKIKIQLIIEPNSEGHFDQVANEITLLERDTLLPETLGLNLAEAKETILFRGPALLNMAK